VAQVVEHLPNMKPQFRTLVPSKKKKKAMIQWLMPVILAIQKAEIRKIKVQSQPHANSSRDPISKNTQDT
jgi:hypothetical protein